MHFKVAYTSIFWKTFIGLTATEQLMVFRGIQEWMAAPTNVGTNFERLHTKAGNIFSIRINDAWRVIMAKFEDTYFLLHTGGQHDQTNDWAKNKRLTRNVTNGAIQMYNGDVEEFEAAKETTAAMPALERRPFADITAEELMVMGVPEEWISSVQGVETEDQLLSLWAYLPNDAVENLQMVYDKEVDLQVLLAQLRARIREMPESLEEQIRIQPGFFVLGEDASLLEELRRDVHIFQFYLHPTQRLLATGLFKGSMKVTGSAGTGKTVVALHRAKFLAERLTEGDKPVLLTTYSRHLMKNIKSLFSAQAIPQEKLVVDNIHRFALEFGQQQGVFEESLNLVNDSFQLRQNWFNFVQSYRGIAWKADFLQAEYEQVVLQQHITTLETYLQANRSGRSVPLNANARTSVWKALEAYQQFQGYQRQYSFQDLIFKLNVFLEQHPEIRPFSHIICDEIQDFSNLEMRLLRNLVPDGPNDLFLCGDPFQNIYQRKLNFTECGIRIRGKRSYRLTLNYRTTEEIRKYAVSMLKGWTFDDFSGNVPSRAGDTSILFGNEPEYILFDHTEEFHQYLRDYIRESFGKIALHEICIAARTNAAVDELYHLFSDAMFPVIRLNEVEAIEETRGRVVLGTLHALKGLEFKNLIVTGFDQSSFPHKPQAFSSWPQDRQQAYLKSEHALYYVAFSRAISQLIVTGIGTAVEW
ncbi:MAG: AAA family ATPase [Saprospiraceae bacterium]|nr:AAA family ATPase [Saprospiraceae bacterium]